MTGDREASSNWHHRAIGGKAKTAGPENIVHLETATAEEVLLELVEGPLLNEETVTAHLGWSDERVVQSPGGASVSITLRPLRRWSSIPPIVVWEELLLHN